MTNEIIFFGYSLFLFGLSLLAFRLGLAAMMVMIALSTVLMNIAVVKQFDLFTLAVTGGNVLYGATFLLTDLLNEHYGKKVAYQAVWIGFASMIFFIISTQIFLLYLPNDFDLAHSSMETLFGLTPRVVLGSFIAFLIAQNLDVFIFDKIKQKTKGQYLWLRNNLSTVISQAIDTVIFTFVGLTTFTVAGKTFLGIINPDIFWEVAIFTFIIKIIVSLLDTPFIYLSYLIKKKENNV